MTVEPRKTLDYTPFPTRNITNKPASRTDSKTDSYGDTPIQILIQFENFVHPTTHPNHVS